MKIKQKPDDFIVEEVPSVSPKDSGGFALFRLEKVGLTSFAAQKALARRCDLNFKDIGFSGMKDAVGRTSQFFSAKVKEPGCGDFKEDRIASEHIGFIDRQLKMGDLKGNRFRIVVRALTEEDIERAERNVERVSFGVPNYFDSQRFGSLRGCDDFVAKDILRGDFESALKRIIGSKLKRHKKVIKDAKDFILDNWGDWKACADFVRKNKVEKTSDGTIVRFLEKNPSDFKGAFRKLYRGIRQFYFTAYHAYIWNETAKRIIKQHSQNNFEVDYLPGKLLFPRDKLLNAQVPMLSADMDKSGEHYDIIEQVLRDDGFRFDDFRIDEYTFVSRLRDLIFVPRNFQVDVQEDELNGGFYKAIVQFELQKGSYATILLKALFEQ